jgi:hypothetical protein
MAWRMTSAYRKLGLETSVMQKAALAAIVALIQADPGFSASLVDVVWQLPAEGFPLSQTIN